MDCAADGFNCLSGRLQTIDAGGPRSGVERFRRMGEEYVRFAVENPAHYRLMYGKEALTRQDLPELREAANAILEQLVSVIQAHQHSGGSNGRIPGGPPEPTSGRGVVVRLLGRFL